MTAYPLGLQLRSVLQMVFEQFQEEQMIGMRTMPGHSGYHNDGHTQPSA